MQRVRILAGILAGAAASVGFAQDDGVVVTATRFKDSRQNLPVGVTVITADDIRKSSTSSLAEILAQFGQVHIRDNTGTPNQQVDLRGFGITGDQNTLVLVDGIRVSENELSSAQLTSIPLESIERIEILRGSGSVLYGSGATGGTINVITRRSESGERRGYAQVRAGGYDTVDLRAGAGARGENLGFSLDASHEDTGGYRENNHYRQTNASGTLEGYGSLGRGYLRFAAADQHVGLPAALTEAQIQADPRQTRTPNDRSERQDATLTLGGALNLGRHELAGDLSYRTKNSSALFNTFGFFVDTNAKVWSFLPRARLRFGPEERSHEIVVGADFEQWDYTTRNSGSPETVSTPFSARHGNQTNQALYAQGSFFLASRTRVTAGLRAQNTEEELSEVVFPLDDRRASHDLKAGELALRQGFSDAWAAYVKYGSSFRLANFDENACFVLPCTTRLLEPQTARTAEVGLEYQSGAWRGRVAAYQTKLQNEIYFSPLVFSNINLAPTQRRGLEMEAIWRAAQTLELRASLALMEATFRSGTYGGTDVSGKTVPLVPEQIAGLGASWSFTEKSRLNVNARYVGKQRYDNDQANTFSREMPAYGLLDAKIEHRIDRVTVALEGRNLLDRRYYSYGIWDGVSATSSFSAYPQPGRALFASVAYRLD
jgi:iron complex outermembrane receptor protein